MSWFKAEPPPPNVTADRGVAAAGDIINSTINFNGLDEEGVRRVLQEELVRIAGAKGVALAPLQAVLAKLGDTGVRDEDIPKLLDAKADELLRLRAEAELLQRGSPALASVAQDAQNLIDKGELAAASRALAKGRESARAQRIDASRDEAKLLALDARVDDLQLAYRSAADKYAEAAKLAAGFDQALSRDLIKSQASELYKQGNEQGDAGALREAIDLYRSLISGAPQAAADSPERAALHRDLGDALRVLGERESAGARLEEAVAAYRAALAERSRQQAPLEWAATQNNLGRALKTLGDREGGTARLNEAVAAIGEAQKEFTRESHAFPWAISETNLGNALFTLGEREGRPERFAAAADAHRAALTVLTRERFPRQWAMAQNDLANALVRLALQGGGTPMLIEAAKAYGAASQVLTRDRAPLHWASIQTNLGNVFLFLGEQEKRPEALEAAVDAYRKAMTLITSDSAAFQWALIQSNLGNALQILGKGESGAARLEEAVGAYDAALTKRSRATGPLQWAASFGEQALTRMLIAERRGDGAMAKTALEQIEAAAAAAREAGDAPTAGYYERQLPKARDLVRSLSKQ